MQLRTIILRAGCAAACVSLLVIHQAAAGVAQPTAFGRNIQNNSRPVIDRLTYERVLDVVFPRDEPASGGTLWGIVLRFKPNAKQESQIVIRKGADKTEVFEYTPDEGSIFDQLNQALERGEPRDPVKLANLIKVSRREVNLPRAQIQHWHATFFEAMSGTTKTLKKAFVKADRTGTESFVLHGSFYDLWYAQGLNVTSFSLYDVDVDDVRSGAEFGLVRWMDVVRRDVARPK